MPVTPLQAATDVLDRADALLALAATPVPSDVQVDLRRMAWAMGAAAVDTYLHWLVRTVDLKKPLTPSLAKLDVRFADLVAMGQASVKARRQRRDDRPMVRARNILHTRVLTDTYQSSRGVTGALNLVGAQKPWARLAVEMNEQPKDIQDHLDRLARRRNYVVHEGDIKRQSKPRQIRRSELSAADARSELDWVRRFVNALGKVAPPPN